MMLDQVKSAGLDRTNDELLIFPALIGIMIVVIAFDDFCKGIRRNLRTVFTKPKFDSNSIFKHNYTINKVIHQPLTYFRLVKISILSFIIIMIYTNTSTAKYHSLSDIFRKSTKSPDHSGLLSPNRSIHETPHPQ